MEMKEDQKISEYFSKLIAMVFQTLRFDFIRQLKNPKVQRP